MRLVLPEMAHLASYTAALERGWSPDTTRPEAGMKELEKIRADAAAFIASMEDRDAKGPPVQLPDGSLVPRLPGFYRWMWDGEFCGSINLRWQPGTADLPPHCLGHIGYSVVPWRRREGLATAALTAMLPQARAVGLPHVIVTCNADNVASERVIRANGGVLVEQFRKGAAFGFAKSLKFRVDLA